MSQLSILEQASLPLTHLLQLEPDGNRVPEWDSVSPCSPVSDFLLETMDRPGYALLMVVADTKVCVVILGRTLNRMGHLYIYLLSGVGC